MIKEHESVFRRLLMASDLILVTAAFFLGYYLRNWIAVFYGEDVIYGTYPLRTYLNLLPVFAGLWMATLYFVGAYQSFRTKNINRILWEIVKSLLLTGIFFGAFVFIFKLHYLSRLLVAVIFSLNLTFLVTERLALVAALRHFRKKGYNYRQMLIVGTGPRAQNFIKVIERHSEWGFRIQGLIDDDPHLKGKMVGGYRVVGLLKDIPAILNRHVVDEIVFVVPRTWLGKIEEMILYCEQVGKRVHVAIDLFNMKFAKAKEMRLEQFPFLTFETTPDKLWQLLIKRVLDMALAGGGIVLLAPFMVGVAVLIKISSKGPVIFKQTRCGLSGRRFTVYKFRTMIPRAEEMLESLRKHSEVKGPAFKMTHDPRLIRFGKWMRKFSIDELPQIINVLQGHMSFIGPRPPIPSEVKKYKPWQMRRLSMRPGITGLWQVRGRSRIVNFDQWMKFDLEYIDQWSLWLDFKIFVRTIPVVLFGIGAK